MNNIKSWYVLLFVILKSVLKVIFIGKCTDCNF